MERKLVIHSDFPDNIFIRQLQERHLFFYTDILRPGEYNSNIAELNDLDWPTTFLAINLSVKSAIEYRQKKLNNFTDIQIIVVRGGQKNFEPIMTFLYENDEEEYYNYENWDDFCRHLFYFPERQKKFFIPIDEGRKRRLGYYADYVLQPQYQKLIKKLADYKQGDFSILHHHFDIGKAAKFFEEMTKISQIYLSWYRLWTEEITKLKFPLKVSYTTNLNRLVKKLEVKVKGDTNFWGLPIFEEDRLIYFSSSLVGQVAKVQENKIIVKIFQDNGCYPRRDELNNTEFFVVHPNNKVISFYENYFTIQSSEIKDQLIKKRKAFVVEPDKIPLDMLTGSLNSWYFNSNYSRILCDLIDCSSIEVKRLLRDSSQAKALVHILSGEAITIVNGAAGTGKTSVVSVAIEQILNPLTKFDNIFTPPNKGRVILVVSHSNVGLDNLLKSVCQKIKNSHFLENKDVDNIIFRLGNNIESVDPEIRKFHGDQRYEFTTWKEIKVDSKRRKNIIKHQIAHGKLKIVKVETDESGKETFYEQKEKSDLDQERGQANCTAILEMIQKGESVILASTLNSLILDPVFSLLKNNGIFVHIGIIDEATRGLSFEFLPALDMIANKLIMIGDPEQLSNLELPRQFHEFALQQNPNLNTKLFERGLFNGILSLGISPDQFLETNRRSLPLLASFVSQACYNGRLRAGRFDPNRDGQISFYDISHLNNNQEKRVGTSLANFKERNVLLKLFIPKLIRHLDKENGKINDLAIIVPYAAQKREIQHSLRKELLFNKRIQQLITITPKNIEEVLQQIVVTVDAMQGSERDIIFWVLTRSNDNGEIGFMENFNRIRVAISRPRNELVIIGNPRPFLECDSNQIKNFFHNILSFIKQKGKYVILQPDQKVRL